MSIRALSPTMNGADLVQNSSLVWTRGMASQHRHRRRQNDKSKGMWGGRNGLRRDVSDVTLQAAPNVFRWPRPSASTLGETPVRCAVCPDGKDRRAPYTIRLLCTDLNSPSNLPDRHSRSDKFLLPPRAAPPFCRPAPCRRPTTSMSQAMATTTTTSGKGKRAVLRFLSINDVYELENLPRFARAVKDARTAARKEEEAGGTVVIKVLAVVCGDFLAPSLLSCLDNGRGACQISRCPLGRVPFKKELPLLTALPSSFPLSLPPSHKQWSTS